jgi:hypothetical protein
VSTKPYRLTLPPPLAQMLAEEADHIGVSIPALLTTDIVRYRTLAAAAVPDLTSWQWSLLSHVMSGTEAHDILSRIDDLPSPLRIAAAIDEWADHALDDETLEAGKLREAVIGWSPLTIAGVLMRLRRDE